MERFRRLQQITALAIILLNTSRVKADDEYFKLTPLPARLVPEYKTCTYQAGLFACYNKDQMLEIFKLEARARYWHDNWLKELTDNSLKNAQIATLEAKIKEHEDIEAEDVKQINIVSDQYSQCSEEKEKYQQKAEHPPTWPLWVGGTLGVLGLGAFLGSLFH